MRLRFSKDRVDEFVEAIQGNHAESFARIAPGRRLTPSEFILLAVACMKAFEESIKLPSNFEEMNPGQKSILRTQRRNAVSAAMIEFHGAYSELRGIYDALKQQDDRVNPAIPYMVDGKADLIITDEGDHCDTAWERSEGETA